MKLRNGHRKLGAELKVFKMLGRHANLTRLYPGPSEVGQRVVTGHRLERPMTPTECPPGVFGVMLKCWEQEAKARPTFAEVKRMILSEFRVGRQGECCICLERKLS
jgi:hypothetical protein